MTNRDDLALTPQQLAALEAFLHRGSQMASQAMAKWIGRPSLIELDALQQSPLAEATTVLSQEPQPICCCAVDFAGFLCGQMVLAFDDASGLTLTDLLLEQPLGSSTEWTDISTSAVLETTNILCCAYLNSLSDEWVTDRPESSELIPGPPQFCREFAESLMEFVLMPQAIQFDQVILATTRFQIDQVPVNWSLLFVPDAESRMKLSDLLRNDGS